MRDENELLTPDEAAAVLRVNADTVRRMVREKRLPALYLSARAIRIRRGDLDALIGAASAEEQAASVAVSPRTGAALREQARRVGAEPGALADRLLAEAHADLEEAVAGIQRGIAAGDAGDEMDFEEYVARDLERRRQRDGARATNAAA